MRRLSIITTIDHQLKGTNLHKIPVLYHLELRRVISPQVEEQCPNEWQSSHHVQIFGDFNVITYNIQCTHVPSSSSLPPSPPRGLNLNNSYWSKK